LVTTTIATVHPAERCRFIKDHQVQFSVSALCRAMQLCPSGFYAWRSRDKSARQLQDERLIEQIMALHQESGETLLSPARWANPRIFAELRKAGTVCSRLR
jgi:hypothetical protein